VNANQRILGEVNLTNHQAVINAALALPDQKRRELAKLLRDTLPTELDDYGDEEWAAELRRRAREAEMDPTRLIPWSAVKKRMRTK
jgi:putative addiction module component (TIGR02574 family)